MIRTLDFASLLPVQAAGVLLQRALPRHGHGQQQGVERRVVEAFTDQTPGGAHDPGCIRGQRFQRCGHRQLPTRVQKSPGVVTPVLVVKVDS